MSMRGYGRIGICLLLIVLASSCVLASGGDCLNGAYDITVTNAQGKPGVLSDNGSKTFIRLKKDVTIGAVRTDGPEARALYLNFSKIPESFVLQFLNEKGVMLSERPFGTPEDPVYGNCLYIKEYGVDIPEGTEEIRFVSGSEGYLAEFQLFAAASELPESAENWEAAPEKADVLFVVAHPDDEHVVMGGIVPYYAAELGRTVQMVYLTADKPSRKAEALMGLWSNGMKNVPVFLDMIDKKTKNLKTAIDVWDKAGEDPLGLLVEQIRRFKPEILVSHDPDGEYGHGAHRAAAYYCTLAAEQAADPSCYPESCEKYGTWDVPKLYLHLFGDDPTVLPFDEPLSAFNGKTAFEMAQVGYAAHQRSQGDDWLRLLRSRVYDCSKYGLYRSLVGPDEQKNDFFEHLDS